MAEPTREQLLKRIAEKYATIEETLHVGALALKFTRVADPDAVLDAICLEEEQRRDHPDKNLEPLRMPYWAAVWESANAVGEFALAMNLNWKLASVLDLGCGMGNAGMILAAAGAQVTLADIDRDALLFAELNTWPWRGACSVNRVNWNVDRLDRTFDLIIGSDVLYERDQWEGLEAFMKIHLNKNGRALIGEPGRAQAESFPDWIAGHGWSVEQKHRSAGDRTNPINIFLLKIVEENCG